MANAVWHARARVGVRQSWPATWHAGDKIGALRIAARFFGRSNDTKIFKRGIDAYDELVEWAKRFNLY